MESDHAPVHPAQPFMDEIIAILLCIKGKVTDETNVGWSSFNKPEDIRKEIDQLVEGVKVLDRKSLSTVDVIFLPTGDYQELAIDNGWSDEYIDLANRFDKAYSELKRLIQSN